MNLTCIADQSLLFSFFLVFSVISEKNNSYPQIFIIATITFLQMLIIPAGMNKNILNYLPKLQQSDTMQYIYIIYLFILFILFIISLFSLYSAVLLLTSRCLYLFYNKLRTQAYCILKKFYIYIKCHLSFVRLWGNKLKIKLC